MNNLKSTINRLDEICHASFQSPDKLQEHLELIAKSKGGRKLGLLALFLS